MTNEESVEITVTDRKPGKGSSRQLRMKQMIPAVVYGPNMDNLNFCFGEIEAVKYSKHKYDNVIFKLKSDNSKLNNLKVLRKTFTVHPLTRRPTHFDFFALDMTQEVRVTVALDFTGKPAGAQEGGVLNIVRRDIEVDCMPDNIPESFTVDVSELGLDASLHASDLKLPDTVKMVTSGSETLATCAEVKEEAEATPAAAPEAGAAPAEGAAPADAAPAGGEKKD